MRIKALLLFFIACSFLSNGKNDVIQIDMSKYRTVNFSTLVKGISCIKLEHRIFDSCIKAASYKDYFYLMGRTIAGNNVVIFKRTGKFVKEITFSDALLVTSLAIIPDQEQLWVVSRGKILNKFKLDGTPIGRVALPFPCVDLTTVNNQDFLVYDGGRNAIEGHSMALTDFKSIHELFLKRIHKREYFSSSQSLYAANTNLDNIFIFPGRTDTIYLYNSKKEVLEPYYHLNFHGDFLTDKMYTKGEFSDQEMHEIITKRKYIYSQYSFYQASGRLFFKLAGKRNDFCTIDLKNNSLLSFDQLFDGYEPTTYNPFIGSDGKNLYFIIEEKALVKHYKKNKCTYPTIQKILPSLTANGSNWILLAIEIKE